MKKFLLLSLVAAGLPALWAQTNSPVAPPPAEDVVDIRAHELYHYKRLGQTIYDGDVVITNSQGTIHCERLTAYTAPGDAASLQPTNIVAETNVTIVFFSNNDTNYVTCDQAVYHWVDSPTNYTLTFTAFGTNVAVMTNSKTTLKGNPLVWDNATEIFHATMKGSQQIRVPAGSERGTNTSPFMNILK